MSWYLHNDFIQKLSCQKFCIINYSSLYVERYLYQCIYCGKSGERLFQMVLYILSFSNSQYVSVVLIVFTFFSRSRDAEWDFSPMFINVINNNFNEVFGSHNQTYYVNTKCIILLYKPKIYLFKYQLYISLLNLSQSCYLCTKCDTTSS